MHAVSYRIRFASFLLRYALRNFAVPAKFGKVVQTRGNGSGKKRRRLQRKDQEHK